MLNNEALAILAADQVLENCTVQGCLTLRSLSRDDDIHLPIVIRNAIVDSIEAPACQFHHPFILENVRLAGEAGFFAGYFHRGFQATASCFGRAVDFQCGGHNKGSAVFSLDDCDFAGFVNFFDCWYEGPFLVRNCRFSGGSNLLGNSGAPYQVRFDVLPIIEGNVGRLDLKGG